MFGKMLTMGLGECIISIYIDIVDKSVPAYAL